MNSSSLHLALVSETFAPEINGVANTLGQLVRGLRARGHRVQLIRPRQKADPAASEDADQLLTRGCPLPGYPGLQWGLPARRRLLREWRQQPPDLLYIATEGPLGLSALRVAKHLAIPVVSGFHTNFQQYAGLYGITALTRLLTHYLRHFHNRTQLTLVPSSSQMTALERRGFQRLALLARGVDSQLFHPGRRCDALRASWGLHPDDLALLYVGRLAAEKNLGLLVQTFHMLRQRYPQRRLRLILVGDGPLRAQLQARLPDALFCGMQHGEVLARHYASGDLFLFPSLSETFGNVVLEALASGLAVVAFDQAAAAQHIAHRHNGMLVRPGDAQGFGEATAELLSEAELLRQVRLNARRHAAPLSWETIVSSFERCLFDVLLARATPINAASSAPPG